MDSCWIQSHIDQRLVLRQPVGRSYADMQESELQIYSTGIIVQQDSYRYRSVVDPGSTGTTVVAIDLQYRCNSTVGFIPVQISSRSWQYRYYSSKLQQSKIIQYGCRILVILNSGAEIIISNNSTSNCRWHHRTANAAGWLPQQLASQQDASEVQMTIAQTKVWAACLGGLGCWSRAACCVCRAGAGLRLVGSRRVSSRLELILTPQLTQRTN